MKMKKVVAIVLSVVLFITMMPEVPVHVKAAAGFGKLYGYVTNAAGESSTNLSRKYAFSNGKATYGYYGIPVTSYLVSISDGGFRRIEKIDENIVVEDYDKDFQLVKSRSIPMELPLFGGCYVGDECNYVVLGQTNGEENDETEVLRIIKYDKDWEKRGSCSVAGINTVVPFNAGSLRMTEADGKLYIHTCHTMYKTSDGVNHQANMTFVLDENTMGITQSYTKIMNIDEGYVSHSFDQYVACDGTNLYRLDHADAYPRSMVLTKSTVENMASCSYKCVAGIAGDAGNNLTGLYAGGFEMAGDMLVSVGNSAYYSGCEDPLTGNRNVYVTFTDKSLDETTQVWLTDYSETDGIDVGVPQLVKASDSVLYVLWEEYDTEAGGVLTRVAKISASGNVEKIYEPIFAPLSVCQPIYTADGNLVWYTTDDSSPDFYKLDTTKLDTYAFSKIDISNCTVTLQEKEHVYSAFDNGEVELSVKYNDLLLEKDEDYSLTYVNTEQIGTATVTITGRGYFTGVINRQYEIVPGEPPISSFNRSITKESITLNWASVHGATGYVTEIKENGTWKLLEDVQECSYTFSGLESGTEYELGVRAYAEVDGIKKYGIRASVVLSTSLPEPSITIAELGEGYIDVTWEPVVGADGYEVTWMDCQVGDILSCQTADIKHSITGLEIGSRYSISVRAYRNSGEIVDYSDYSTSKLVTIPKDLTGGDIQVKFGRESYPYQSTEVLPGFTVYDGSTQIASSGRYTVSYENNTGVGTATLILTGYDKYCGTLRVPFEIVPTKSYFSSSTKILDTSIQLVWKEVADATGYYVYMLEGDEYKQIADTTEPQYEVKNLQPQTYYKFKVTAYTLKNDKLYMGLESDAESMKTKSASTATTTQTTTSQQVTTTPQVTTSQQSTTTPQVTTEPQSTTTPQDTTKPQSSTTPQDTTKPQSTTTPRATETTESQSSTVQPGTTGQEQETTTRKEEGTTKSEEQTTTKNPATEETFDWRFDISKAKVVLVKAENTYTGKDQNPAVSSVILGTVLLRYGVDYEVEYIKAKQVGTYTISVKGIGQYKGKATTTYTIIPRSIKSGWIKSEISSKAEYTGSRRAVAVKLKYASISLNKNRDYRITYQNNTKIGIATVTIKGIGNYSGIIKKKFEIVPKKPAIKKIVNQREGKIKIYLETVKGATSYKIFYRIKGKKKWSAITTEKTTVKLSGLKKSKVYQIKVSARAKSGGRTYCSADSKVVSVRIKK